MRSFVIFFFFLLTPSSQSVQTSNATPSRKDPQAQQITKNLNDADYRNPEEQSHGTTNGTQQCSKRDGWTLCHNFKLELVIVDSHGNKVLLEFITQTGPEALIQVQCLLGIVSDNRRSLVDGDFAWGKGTVGNPISLANLQSLRVIKVRIAVYIRLVFQISAKSHFSPVGITPMSASTLCGEYMVDTVVSALALSVFRRL
mmetsp:Transcript_20775/g.57438  ORF Transcript_20775/g.57438 Transcript_20775/m.57438 type:complete len:200 (-) Transcript_20775:1090-1689(-)